MTPTQRGSKLRRRPVKACVLTLRISTVRPGCSPTLDTSNGDGDGDDDGADADGDAAVRA